MPRLHASRPRSSQLRAAMSLVVGSLLLGFTSLPAAVLIDFEDLPAPGNGSGGLPVLDDYRCLGILFNQPTALDYSRGTPILPGFARSGTKAITLCYGSEFCRVPLEMTFAAGQSHVSVVVGYSAPLDAPRNVVLKAFDGAGVELDFAVATLGASTAPIPIRVHLGVSFASPKILRATVGFLEAEDPSPTSDNNGLAVDDVGFDGLPASPGPAQPPSLTVHAPEDGYAVEENAFKLDASIATPDPTATFQFDITHMDGSTIRHGPAFVSSGDLSLALTDQLAEGRNVVVATVRDCQGTAQVTRTLFLRPSIHVEVTQAIQDLENRVPLFVGKRTLARAYVNTASPTVVTAAIYSADDLTTPVWGPVSSPPTPVPAAIDRAILSHTINFELPLGPTQEGPWLLRWLPGHEYVLQTTVHEPLRSPITAWTPLVFYDSVPLALKPVWVINASGERVAEETLARVVKRLNVLYPIRRIIVHDDGFTLPEDQASWPMLTTWINIRRWLDDLAIENGEVPRGCSSCFWSMLHVVPEGRGWGLALLNTHVSTVGLTAYDIDEATWVLAQELGHDLGLLHASPDHGEQPPGEPSTVNEFFPYYHGGMTDTLTHRYWTNVLSRGRHHGADPMTDPARPQDAWWIIPGHYGNDSFHYHDFMSYGDYTWASDYTYARLSCANVWGRFDSWYSAASSFPPGTLSPICVSPFSIGRPPAGQVSLAGGAGAEPGGRVTTGEWTRVVVVTGTIRPGAGASFGPGYVLDQRSTPELTEPGASPFCVRLLGASGEVLGQKALQPQTHHEGDLHFGLAMPWDERTTWIAIVDEANGGAELGRMARRLGQPTGSFTSVPRGLLDKPKEVRWQVRHPDGGGGLFSSLAYSPDGGASWVVIAANLTQTHYRLDPAVLPGGAQGQLRLIVSDGLQTSYADSPAQLVVAPRPPRITIVSPGNGTRVHAGARLFLRAYGTSPQTGVLDESAFAWFSEGTLLGQGTEVEARGMTAGHHLIRLVATDPDGLTSEAQVAVFLDPKSIAVLGDAPGTTIPSIASGGDAGGPEITVRLAPDVLWPPDHKLVGVTATVTVRDATDPAPEFLLESITSSDPDHGNGDPTKNDIQGAEIGTADTRFDLRAERKGGERAYVACYRAINASGGTAEACDTVFVPHDQAGAAALSVAGPNVRLLVFGTAAAPARGVSTGSVEIGSDATASVAADATAPAYADLNSDGIDDAMFSFDVHADRLRAWIGSGTELFARWSNADRSCLASLPPTAVLAAAVPDAPRGLKVVVSPNPLRREARIRYSLPVAGRVRLVLYDLAGREVARLVDRDVPAGDHEARWTGPNGAQIYYYRLTAMGQTMTGKLVMLRQGN